MSSLYYVQGWSTFASGASNLANKATEKVKIISCTWNWYVQDIYWLGNVILIYTTKLFLICKSSAMDLIFKFHHCQCNSVFPNLKVNGNILEINLSKCQFQDCMNATYECQIWCCVCFANSKVRTDKKKFKLKSLWKNRDLVSEKKKIMKYTLSLHHMVVQIVNFEEKHRFTPTPWVKAAKKKKKENKKK